MHATITKTEKGAFGSSLFFKNSEHPRISGRVDRASATEAVDLGSILGRVKPKTIKIGIHSFPA